MKYFNYLSALFLANTLLTSVTLANTPVDQSANLNIPDQPLTALSARVDPNVMLLIDNSGSMDNIIWHDGYNPSVTYERWAYYHSSFNNWYWVPTSGTMYENVLGRSSCPWGYSRFWDVKGSNSRNYKCMIIPDPEAGSTRFDSNYINYLLATFPNNSDLRNLVPNETRMQVARNVAANLIQNTPDVRFGVSRFNNNHGGAVVQECGASTNALVDAINSLNANSWTPLSEAYYEITRYFRGLSSFYNSGVTYSSPIQYRCQKNFSVVITDGLPTYDNTFSSNDPDDPDGLLPNWDGLSSGLFTDGDNTNCNDTFGSSNNCGSEGRTSFLDDIAKFAWDVDMRSSGTDLAGKSFNDEDFENQNMYTYTVGFTTANQMLENAANYGNGRYYTADNAQQLENVLSRALADIASKTLKVSASAANQSSFSQDTNVFNTEFTPEIWTGDLSARELTRNGSQFTFTTVWSAAEQLDARSYALRQVFTNINNTATRWNATNTSLVNYINHSRPNDIINYILGDDTNEGPDNGDFRERTSKLGTIVDSAPAYVGQPNFRYSDLLESEEYSSFVDEHKNRQPIVYVGSNSGMLHAFNADTGVEIFAFIPGEINQNVARLADQNYEHAYFVNGSPVVRDAFINQEWTTVLTSGLGKGGQSIFALDVTEPTNVSNSSLTNKFLWEFTDENDSDLGFTFGEPTIIRLSNGTWAAAFANGYNNTLDDGHSSSSGNAVLYIVDLEDGSLIKKFDTGVGIQQDPSSTKRANGLSNINPIDVNNNSITDFIYAGDLQGNLWKFDIRDTNINNWSISNNGSPLFTACADANCNIRQSITNKPTVTKHPWGGFMVYFGTGKYIETGDKSADSNETQSFYAIWDKDSSAVTRSQLLEQVATNMNYTFTTADGGSSSEDIRLVTNNRPNWTQNRGWYIDLPTTRERQVSAPILRNDKIIFTTLIPVIDSDPCVSESEGYLMELDALTGGRLKYSVFDFNQSSSFGIGDTVVSDSGSQVVSGRKLDGYLPTPLILDDPDAGLEYKITGDNVVVENPGIAATGRQSWRQIFVE